MGAGRTRRDDEFAGCAVLGGHSIGERAWQPMSWREFKSWPELLVLAVFLVLEAIYLWFTD